MSKSYARLKIKESKNVLNFDKFSFIATFVTSSGRVGITSKLPIQANGLGAEVYYKLKKMKILQNQQFLLKYSFLRARNTIQMFQFMVRLIQKNKVLVQ